MKYPTDALDKKFMTNLRIAVSGWLKNEENISLKFLLDEEEKNEILIFMCLK